MKEALVIQGGWAGHQPRQFAAVVSDHLASAGAKVDLRDSLEVLDDAAGLARYDLIVPIWTMGELTGERERNLLRAVEAGAGLAGWHGGMGDAFRANLDYKMMVGGQFVSHPGNVRRYQVRITDRHDPITAGLEDFQISSEQYYMHVDPGNEVLAETTFSGDDLPWIEGVVMPVAWKRRWGRGKVFYLAIGHQVDEFEIPQVWAMVTRGMAWASR